MWLAEDTETNRTVTVRLHDPDRDPASRRAFLRDARRLTETTHPNVVAVLDAGIEDDVPYVVMEHLDGVALHTLARSNGRRLPAPLVVSVGAQLARALTALHRAGVTHGGLEASRVVLLPDGTVRLSLFEPGRSSGPSGRSEDLRALCDILLLLTSGTSRLAVPIDSRHLDRLPAALRIHYAHAFDQLMSASSATQAQGVDLLTDPRSLARAREAYEPRRYEALGALRVTSPDGSPALGPGVRALLAMLLLKHGRTVTHEELRWGLWDPGEEPRNPRGDVNGLATRLAEALGPGALVTSAHGLALHTSADDVDLVRCDELVRQADAARLEGAPTEARALVTEALSLWHGAESLADVPGPAARTARARLLRLRLALHTKRAELDLALGDYDRASAELSRLLRAHPHREDFRRLCLIALRRQGRGAEALEVYEEYELSGGRSPALAALGRELREEHAEPVDDAPWSEYEGISSERDDGPHRALSAPDELPEGPFPTEDVWSPRLEEAAESTEEEPEEPEEPEAPRNRKSPRSPARRPRRTKTRGTTSTPTSATAPASRSPRALRARRTPTRGCAPWSRTCWRTAHSTAPRTDSWRTGRACSSCWSRGRRPPRSCGRPWTACPNSWRTSARSGCSSSSGRWSSGWTGPRSSPSAPAPGRSARSWTRPTRRRSSSSPTPSTTTRYRNRGRTDPPSIRTCSGRWTTRPAGTARWRVPGALGWRRRTAAP
ncbi:BTAD domain-containing putative transcriptional regulator [Streptomyces sp. CA-100214]